jgi:hypothetical protein
LTRFRFSHFLGKPVPLFGDPQKRFPLLMVGCAGGAIRRVLAAARLYSSEVCMVPAPWRLGLSPAFAEKRPADVIGNAVHVMRIAMGGGGRGRCAYVSFAVRKQRSPMQEAAAEAFPRVNFCATNRTLSLNFLQGQAEIQRQNAEDARKNSN